MLQTILFALLWFVLGVVATFIFAVWGWSKSRDYDSYEHDEYIKNVEEIGTDWADILFPKK